MKLGKIRWHNLGLCEVRREREITLDSPSRPPDILPRGTTTTPRWREVYSKQVVSGQRTSLLSLSIGIAPIKWPLRKWTWQNPDAVTKNEIDFIMMDRNYKRPEPWQCDRDPQGWRFCQMQRKSRKLNLFERTLTLNKGTTWDPPVTSLAKRTLNRKICKLVRYDLRWYSFDWKSYGV